MKNCLCLIIISYLFSSQNLWAQTTLRNSKDIRKKLNVENLFQRAKLNQKLSKIKIAIIDYGFQGIKESGSLPKNFELVEFYPKEMIERFDLNPSFPGNSFLNDRHGTSMAQIVWGMTGELKDGPKMYLLNGNGFTNFRRAVRFAIEKEVDIVLYSQNWEVGGNFDGHGFINKIVSKAINQGILWVNSSGNYGGQVHLGNVNEGIYKKYYFENHLDENQFSVNLIWNDFTDDYNYQSIKDLDLIITDEVSGKIVARGELAQNLSKENDSRKKSLYSREKVSVLLQKGLYSISIIDKSHNFHREDYFRLIVSAPRKSYIFESANEKGEILTPADHFDVVTVGDREEESSKGMTQDGRMKPEIYMPMNEAKFTNGLETKGTSNSAAYLAGVAVLLKSLNENTVTKETLRSFINSEGLRKRVSLNLFPNNLIQLLTTIGGIYYNDLKGFRHSDGHLMLKLPIHPTRLPRSFFGNVQNTARNLKKSLKDFRYFIHYDQRFFDPILGYFKTTYFLKSNPTPLHFSSIELF